MVFFAAEQDNGAVNFFAELYKLFQWQALGVMLRADGHAEITVPVGFRQAAYGNFVLFRNEIIEPLAVVFYAESQLFGSAEIPIYNVDVWHIIVLQVYQEPLLQIKLIESAGWPAQTGFDDAGAQVMVQIHYVIEAFLFQLRNQVVQAIAEVVSFIDVGVIFYDAAEALFGAVMYFGIA